MADIRYEDPNEKSTPAYAANAYRIIDKHYKPRKLDYKGEKLLLPTDYGSVIDFRDLEGGNSLDKSRVIPICKSKPISTQLPITTDNTDGDNNNNSNNTTTNNNNQDSTFSWFIPDDFELSTAGYKPSLCPPVNGDGLPHGFKLPPQVNNNPKKKLAYLQQLVDNKQLRPYPIQRFDQPAEQPDALYCGGASTEYYAMQDVPGLFVINKALRYSEQLMYSLKAFLLYDHGYTNLYNLFFRIPERGTLGDLETLPDQSNLPEDERVEVLDDIHNLFIKTCSKNIGPKAKTTTTTTTSTTNNTNNNSNNGSYIVTPPLLSEFSVYSPYKKLSETETTETTTETTTNLHNYDITQCLNIFPNSAIADDFHAEGQYNIAQLLRLRWANLGKYVYDWTLRQYTEGYSDPLDPDLKDISMKVLNPLIQKDLIYDANLQKVASKDIYLETAIVNYYPTQHAAVIASHIDDGEPSRAPLVSFSLGSSCVFLCGGTKRGDAPVHIFLRSGDVIVQSQISRLSWHAVPRVIEGSAPIYPLFVASCALLDVYYMSKNNVEFDVEKYMMQHQIPDNSPLYISNETLIQFKSLIDTLHNDRNGKDLLGDYELNIEQIITFCLHMLCEYRINFNTRQIIDPNNKDFKPEDVRKLYPIDAVKAGIYG